METVVSPEVTQVHPLGVTLASAFSLYSGPVINDQVGTPEPSEHWWAFTKGVCKN